MYSRKTTIDTELKHFRCKLKEIKERNKNYIEESKRISVQLNNHDSVKDKLNLDNKTTRVVKTHGSNFSYNQEAMAVENCFKQCVTLVEQYSKLKKDQKYKFRSISFNKNGNVNTFDKNSNNKMHCNVPNSLKEFTDYRANEKCKITVPMQSQFILYRRSPNFNNDCQKENKKSQNFKNDNITVITVSDENDVFPKRPGLKIDNKKKRKQNFKEKFPRNQNSTTFLNSKKRKKKAFFLKSNTLTKTKEDSGFVSKVNINSIHNNFNKKSKIKNQKNLFQASEGSTANDNSNKEVIYLGNVDNLLIKNLKQNVNKEIEYINLLDSTTTNVKYKDSCFDKIHKEQILNHNCSFVSEIVNISKKNPKNIYQSCSKSVEDQAEKTEEFFESTVPVWDFAEEPVNFAIPILHQNENLCTRPTGNEIKLFQLNGISIKSGTWSEDEESLLERNYKNFTQEFGVSDPRFLLGIGRRFSSNKSEFKDCQKFLKAKHFYLRLGKDLDHRPLHQIYLKARNMFDPYEKNEKCKSKDLSEVLELQKKYGNQWYIIAQKMKRSIKYCHTLFRENAKANKNGNWTKQELENLMSAIRSVTNISNLSHVNLKTIPWNKVSELVPTRNAGQCCSQWQHQNLLSLKAKFSSDKWDKDSKAKLVSILKNKLCVKEECEIDWKEVAKYFADEFSSSTIIKHKYFHTIKRNIPKNLKKDYQKTLNFLYEKYSKNMKDT